MQAVNEHLRELLQPVVQALGYEWVGLEYQSSVLCIYIDSPEGITLDDCTRVSHQVSGVLDVEDPIAENYRLEISSPGLDRPLFTPEQFQRFLGQQVVLRFHGKWQGRRKLVGELLGHEAEGISIQAEGERFLVPHEQVRSARLVPVFD